MSYTLTISNNPYLPKAGTLLVDNTIGKTGTASFTLQTSTNRHFQQFEPVAITDDHGNLAFSGYLNIPIKEQKLGYAPILAHTLTCIDQAWLAHKRVIAVAYQNKTCGYIAQDIVKNILSQEGVTVGQIYDGLAPSDTLYPSNTLYPGGNVGPIPNATFVYCKVSDALDALVKQASTGGIPYYWSIDQYKRFYFVPYTAIVNSTPIDGTTFDQEAAPITVSRQNPTYRNTQYITGGVAQTLPQVRSFVGDNNLTTWTLDFDVYSISEIDVNSVKKTIGIKGIDTGKSFYYQQGSPDISQDSSAAKLQSTDTLTISYIGQYPSTILASNNAQIDYQASIDGTSGIIEDVQTDNTLTSTANGLSEASQLLTRYAQQGVQLVGTTMYSGYAPGQLVPVNLPDHGLHNVQMLIEDVTASDQIDTYNIWYTVSAVMGPSDITWVDFFSAVLKQQAPANSINVGVAQTITLLASLQVSAQVRASLQATVFPAVFPSNTLYPRNDLYPG